MQGWFKEDQPCDFDDIPAPEPVKIPVNPEYSFKEGYCYIIGGGDYVYCYEGKQGKHHVFRETRGKWTRTYTDAQLVGKKIQEVKI